MCAMAKLKCLRFARTSGGWLNEQYKVLVIALVGAVVTSVIFFLYRCGLLMMFFFHFFQWFSIFCIRLVRFFYLYKSAENMFLYKLIFWWAHAASNWKQKKNRDDGKNNANHRKISCIWMCAQICACRVCLYAWICYDVHCPKCMRIAVAVAMVSVRIEFIGSCHEKIK